MDIFSHRRMPILAVLRLHLIDPSSIVHNSVCYIYICIFVTTFAYVVVHRTLYVAELRRFDGFMALCSFLS